MVAALPVVGWLFPGNPLRRSRGENLRLALVELANGLLLAALVWAEFPQGLVAAAPDPFAVPGLEFLAPDRAALGLQVLRWLGHAVLVQALLAASVIDLRLMIIPDGSTLPAMLFALLLSLCGGLPLVPVWFEDVGALAVFGIGDNWEGGIEVTTLVNHPHWHGLTVAVAGLLIGGGIVWAVRLIGHWALGREAMGFGDVILMALIGAYLGWQPVLVVFFLAPICALVVLAGSLLTGRNREFPYGPWLSAAAILLLLGWQSIWPFAGRFFLLGRVIPMMGVGILVLLAVLLRAMRLIRGEAAYAEWPEEPGWTSADQLLYQSQEKPSPPPASWDARRTAWPGIAAGQRAHAEQRWRSGR